MELFSKLVKIVETEVVTQQVFVNNEIKNVTAKAFAMVCPSCGRVIQNFQPGVPKYVCIQSILPHKDDLTKHFRYCPECGQKLNYEFALIEGEVKFSNDK